MLPARLSSAALSSDTLLKKLDRVLASPYDGLRLAAWEEELQDDEDRDFTLTEKNALPRIIFANS